jgi:type II secretory pathway pseudopilin PulG
MELVVAMTIIAIMAAFMASAIGEWLDNFRIKQAARDVSSVLQLAKMKAIESRLEYNVVFDVTNHTYKLWRHDPNTDWTPEGAHYTVPRGVSIDTKLITPFSLTMTARHLPGLLRLIMSKARHLKLSCTIPAG